MNHSTSGQTPAERAILGFVNYKTAEGLSIHTVEGYQRVLELWIEHEGYMPIGMIQAGVKNAYPHKFRHTFAIIYLRSGRDMFTLQILLVHGSLDMVRYYAQIAQVDVEQAQNRAIPDFHFSAHGFSP